jgi:hypothetical protein
VNGLAVNAYLIPLTWIAVHFLAYAWSLRARQSFCREGTIFRYHAVSFVALLTVMALTAWFVPGLLDFARFCAAGALHAIYSMTFLELWSLAEGSISGRILASFLKAGRPLALADVEHLVAYGAQKKELRLASAQNLALISKNGAHWILTPRGRVVATVIRLFAWLNNVDRLG